MSSDRQTVTSEFFEEISQKPTLMTILPFEFENGSAVTYLDVHCAHCQRTVADEQIHAEVKLNKKTALLQGFALCQECKTISPITIRFNDNGMYRSHTGKGWVKGRYVTGYKNIVAAYAPPLIALIFFVVGILTLKNS